MFSDDMSVLDVGGRDVGGTGSFSKVSEQWTGGRWNVTVADLEGGGGVQVVLDKPGKLPFDDETFDAAVSTSCFEHDIAFWDTFVEMCRVVKSGGVIYINAPSSGSFHGYRGDYWRFYPDSGIAMAQLATKKGCALELFQSFIGDASRKGGVLFDFVGVFIRKTKGKQGKEVQELRTEENSKRNVDDEHECAGGEQPTQMKKLPMDLQTDHSPLSPNCFDHWRFDVPADILTGLSRDHCERDLRTYRWIVETYL